MDGKLKMEIAKGMAPAAVPIIQAGITSYFENQRFEKRKEYEMQMAEHKSEALATAVGGPVEGGETAAVGPQASVGGETAPAAAGEPAPGEDPLGEAAEMAGDLDQRIAQAREHEDCGFCRDVLDELRHEDLGAQQQGLRELRELRGVMNRDTSRQEIEQTMDSFEVVPRLVV